MVVQSSLYCCQRKRDRDFPLEQYPNTNVICLLQGGMGCALLSQPEKIKQVSDFIFTNSDLIFVFVALCVFVVVFFQQRFYGYLQNDDSVLFISFLCLLYFFHWAISFFSDQWHCISR